MTRPSKREVERRLDDVDAGEEYPRAYLCQMLAYDWEPVDAEGHLYRADQDGRVYRWSQATVDKIREMIQ